MLLSADERLLVATVLATFGAAHLAVGLPLWLWLPTVISLLVPLRPGLFIVAAMVVISVRSHDALDELRPAATRLLDR